MAFEKGGGEFALAAERVAAHRRAWERLAAPGTWWTGAERVAIAAETRRAPDCALCRERKQALSPAAVGGEHDHGGRLPPPAVEAVHRLVTDSGRLTRAWYESLLAAGLSDAAYVELLGVVTQVISIDSFHRALGLPLEPLPEPKAGEPSRRRPEGARTDAGWVPMLAPGRLPPEEADLFGTVPTTANVLRALSLVPAEVRALRDLSAAHYLPDDQVMDPRANGGRRLSRAQMELLAARVSALNECFY